MAKVASDATYTDAELLANLRQSYAEATVAKSHSQRGKTVVHQDLPTLAKEIARLEEKIARAGGSTSIIKTRHSRS